MKRVILSLTGRFVVFALAAFIVLGPLSSLVLWSIAGEWYWPNPLPTELTGSYWERAFSGRLLDSLVLSLVIALGVTVLVAVVTVPTAYFIARNQLPLHWIFLLVFLLPQAFPQLPVFSNALEFMYRLNLVGTVPGVVIIHLVGAVVFSVWTLVSVFSSIRPALEEASYTLGAGQLRTFLQISLPMALPGIIASSLLVFLYSLDEFTGTLLVGAPFVTTLPITMYNAAGGYELQIASVIGLILTVPGLILLLLTQKFLRAEYLAAFGR